MLKLINDKKEHLDKDFINYNGLLPKVVRENDKLFHALKAPLGLSKHLLHQAHNALGHSGTATTYQCLKQLYFWKAVSKDVDIHMKKYIKCRQQNLCHQLYTQLHSDICTSL